jgi:hypothetical protein
VHVFADTLVGVRVGVRVGVLVGVHVGGNVGMGSNCVSWLLLSLLSATWLLMSTVAVFDPEIAVEPEREC